MRKIREFNKKLRDHKTPSVDQRVDHKIVDRRSGQADRRQTHTFILKDRRSGIADRRRNNNFRP